MFQENPLSWTPDAKARLQRVPEGAMREMTRQRVERLARQRGQSTVTAELMGAKYRQWAEGSAQAGSHMAWTDEARERIERVPSFVKGMAEEALEAYARSRQIGQITTEVLDEAMRFWRETGRFHSP